MHVFPSRNLMIICPTLNRFPDIFDFFLKPENPNLHLGLVIGGKGTRPVPLQYTLRSGLRNRSFVQGFPLKIPF